MAGGGTLKLGLIGNGIGRTKVHKLHQVLGTMAGIPVVYDLIDGADVTAFDIARQLEACAAAGYRGVNVTHPYKREAFKTTRPSPALPPGLTSVNTVLFDRDGMNSTNTDYTGFARAFRTALGDHARPGRVLLVGAGGVGIAIGYALARLGAAEVVVADLDPAPALSLAEGLARFGTAARAAGPDLAAETAGVDGLVNATPLGMYQYPGCPLPAAAIGGQSWAFDAVYTPFDTAFLKGAARSGLQTISGFQLFFYQGVDAFERFSGAKVDADAALAAFLQQHPLES